MGLGGTAYPRPGASGASGVSVRMVKLNADNVRSATSCSTATGSYWRTASGADPCLEQSFTRLRVLPGRQILASEGRSASFTTKMVTPASLGLRTAAAQT